MDTQLSLGFAWRILTVFILFTSVRHKSEIYRIVSNKALQSSDDVIKPSGGETITVQPSADDGGQQKKGGCC